MLEENKNTPIERKESENIDEKQYVYVKKWMKTKHAILFRLSNKIVQVSFLDQTEIILSSETKIVTYMDKKGQLSTYPLDKKIEIYQTNFDAYAYGKKSWKWTTIWKYDEYYCETFTKSKSLNYFKNTLRIYIYFIIK